MCLKAKQHFVQFAKGATKCRGNMRNEVFAACSANEDKRRKEKGKLKGINHPKIVICELCISANNNCG